MSKNKIYKVTKPISYSQSIVKHVKEIDLTAEDIELLVTELSCKIDKYPGAVKKEFFKQLTKAYVDNHGAK